MSFGYPPQTPARAYFDNNWKDDSSDVLVQLPHCDYYNPSGQTFPPEQRSGHNIQRRRLIVPGLIILLSIGCCIIWVFGHWHGSSTWDNDTQGSVVRRASIDLKPSTENKLDNFVHRKLYLIVIFVGLLVGALGGMMWASCCCQKAFDNPCCCPCYVFKCCGGSETCMGCIKNEIECCELDDCLQWFCTNSDK